MPGPKTKNSVESSSEKPDCLVVGIVVDVLKVLGRPSAGVGAAVQNTVGVVETTAEARAGAGGGTEARGQDASSWLRRWADGTEVTEVVAGAVLSCRMSVIVREMEGV